MPTPGSVERQPWEFPLPGFAFGEDARRLLEGESCQYSSARSVKKWWRSTTSSARRSSERALLARPTYGVFPRPNPTLVAHRQRIAT